MPHYYYPEQRDSGYPPFWTKYFVVGPCLDVYCEHGIHNAVYAYIIGEPLSVRHKGDNKTCAEENWEFSLTPHYT